MRSRGRLRPRDSKRGEPLVSAGGASGVLSGRSSRPLRSEQTVKALAAEERIGGAPLRPRTRDRGSRGRTVAGRHLRRPGTCLSGAGSRVDWWIGLGCDVVVEVEDVGGVVAALDLP